MNDVTSNPLVRLKSTRYDYQVIGNTPYAWHLWTTKRKVDKVRRYNLGFMNMSLVISNDLSILEPVGTVRL